MQRYYRVVIWAPILVPGLLWLGTRQFGYPGWEPVGFVVGLLLISLRFGAIPYALLAAWGTWRVRDLDETEIRRLALRAPLLMIAVFLPIALVVGALGGDLLGGINLFAAGAVFILVLGYAYVALALLLRWVWAHATSRRSHPVST